MNTKKKTTPVLGELKNLIFPTYESALEYAHTITNHYELVVKKQYVLARVKVDERVMYSETFNGAKAYENAKNWISAKRKQLWLSIMEGTYARDDE